MESDSIKLTSHKWLTTVGIFAVLTTLCVLYWPGLYGPFLLDDWSNTVRIRLHELRWQDMLDVIFSNASGQLGRPVAVLSFALNYYFSGLTEFSYKLTNLMIHLLTGLGLFWLGKRLLASGSQSNRQGFLWVSGLAAVLWLIHPIQVSTVLYVVQRMAQLSALFTVLALLTYIIGRQRLAQDRSFGLAIMVAGTVLFGALAVFSKESGALLPFYLLLIEAFFFRFAAQSRSTRLQLWGFHAVFVILPLIAVAVYFVIHFQGILASYQTRDFSASQRLLTEAWALWFYLKLIFLPRAADFSLYHDDFPVSTSLDLSTSLAIAGIIGLIALVPILWKRAPIAAFGIAWFLVGHLMESTIIPLELVFEHRNYLALYGPMLAVSYYLLQPSLLLAGKVRLGIASVLVILFAVITSVLVDTWSSYEKFAHITVLNHPNSVRLQLDMAHIASQKGDHQQAFAYLSKLVQSNPHDPGMAVLKTSLICSIRPVRIEDIQQAAAVIRKASAPGQASSMLSQLGPTLRQRKCPSYQYEWFIELVDSALANPRIAQGASRYFLLMERARVLRDLGQNNEALQTYELAHSANVKELRPLFEMGYMLLNENQLEAAVEMVKRLREADAKTIRYQGHEIDEFAKEIDRTRHNLSQSQAPKDEKSLNPVF